MSSIRRLLPLAEADEIAAELTLQLERYVLASRFGPRSFRTVEVQGRDRRFDAPDERAA